MQKLFFLTILYIVSAALCFPSDYVIVDSSIPVRDCESEREEIIEEPDIVNSNEYNSHSVEEPVATSSIEEIRIQKRDLESKKQVAITDIISNVEDSLLSSAYHVNNIYRNVTKAKNNETDSELVTETATTDRLKREDSKSGNGDSESTTASIEIATEQTTNSTYKIKPKAVISHLVAHDVPVTDEKPAHLVVNHVAVYVPPKDHVSVLPSFGLKLNGEKHEAIKELENKTANNLGNNETEISSTETVIDSTDSTVSTTIKIDCDTKNQADAINCHSTTPKTPVEKLKEVEEHVKEKAAEVEADPVILSSRV